MTVEWELEISRDGLWPFPWRWSVLRRQRDPYDVDIRSGDALTKDRARRRALAAKRSMERDDVKVIL